ncbi:winged helix DNA-binding domain-containing protein [soil metagenome]
MASGVPVLSTRQLNRALLARQRLLARDTGTLVDLVEAMGGIQAQYAPSAYIGTWSRLAGFERAHLTAALERREVVQATLMRSTIHIVSAADYWPLTFAVRRTRREWFERVSRRELHTLDMPGAAATTREILAGGPLRMPELTVRLADRGHPEPAARWVGMYLDLVRVPPSGTWEQRRADLYGLAQQWLPRPAGLDEAAGLRLLARRYLGAFGPASLADMASWAGVPASLLRPVVADLPVRRFRDEQGRELLDLAGALWADAEAPAPVRFVPTWDATLLVHARRTQILPEEHRPLVFHTRTPHSFPTFLVDGQVAGRWRFEDGRVQLEPFSELSSSAVAELEAEAAGLAALHG